MDYDVFQLIEDRALFAGALLALNKTLPKYIVETLKQSKNYTEAVERAEELLNGRMGTKTF